jgi:hypothetical protein
MLKHLLSCPQFCLSELQIAVPLKNAIKARKFNSDAEGLKVSKSIVLEKQHIILADSVPFMYQYLFLFAYQNQTKSR